MVLDSLDRLENKPCHAACSISFTRLLRVWGAPGQGHELLVPGSVIACLCLVLGEPLAQPPANGAPRLGGNTAWA